MTPQILTAVFVIASLVCFGIAALWGTVVLLYLRSINKNTKHKTERDRAISQIEAPATTTDSHQTVYNITPTLPLE